MLLFPLTPKKDKTLEKEWQQNFSKVALTVQDLGTNSPISEYSTEGMFFIEVGNSLADPFHNIPDAWRTDRVFTFPYPKRPGQIRGGGKAKGYTKGVAN